MPVNTDTAFQVANSKTAELKKLAGSPQRKQGRQNQSTLACSAGSDLSHALDSTCGVLFPRLFSRPLI